MAVEFGLDGKEEFLADDTKNAFRRAGAIVSMFMASQALYRVLKPSETRDALVKNAIKLIIQWEKDWSKIPEWVRKGLEASQIGGSGAPDGSESAAVVAVAASASAEEPKPQE